jgi:four helix bundle protein
VDSRQWKAILAGSGDWSNANMESKKQKPTDGNVSHPSDYRDLLVWQKGMSLAKQIYQITQAFPRAERFRLISQMRRAAGSVPSNIAEGQARNTTGEFIQFLSQSLGSVSELHTQLLLSVDLGFCTPPEAEPAHAVIIELRKMLTSLRKKLSQV